MIRAVPTAFAVVVLTLPTVSQDRSSLTGTWAASTDKPTGIDAAPSPTMGARFALAVSGDSLTLTRPTRDDSLAVTFKLDGSRSSYTIPGRLCEGEAQVFETASWESGALTLTVVGRVPAGGGTPTTLSVKRLMRPTGDTLVVEASITQAGVAKPVATVYKRSTDALAAPKPVAAPAVKGIAATIADVAWIGGVWSGLNGTSTVEERWTPPASGGMIGVSRTLRGPSLGSFEFLCLAERSGSVVYHAMPDARFPATVFTMTAFTADSATFENPTHDFPKVIKYAKRADGALETSISGAPGSRVTTFVMQKQ